jgi:hypothetical protein
MYSHFRFSKQHQKNDIHKKSAFAQKVERQKMAQLKKIKMDVTLNFY